MPILALGEVLAKTEYLAEVKIIRQLNKEEARKVAGYDEALENNLTYFEVFFEYEYINHEEINKKIILCQFGTHEWQIYADPIYKSGDRYIMFLAKNRKTDGYYGSMGGPNGTLDIAKKNGTKYVYKRLGHFDELVDVSLPMQEGEDKVQKNGKDNPTRYTQKFRLDEFVFVIKKHYDNMEQNQ